MRNERMAHMTHKAIQHRNYRCWSGNYCSTLKRTRKSRNFLHQELISYCYSSGCCCCCCCWVTVFEKSLKGAVDSNRIWMKFGSNVLQVNIHRLTESDFRFDATLWRRRPWRHFTQKSAATWWVKAKHLLGTYAITLVVDSSWSIVHSLYISLLNLVVLVVILVEVTSS